MKNLMLDLRLAVRQLRRSPGFVFSAVVILALGIAANVIVFGILQGLILQPLNVPHPERVQQLARTNQEYPMFSFPEVRDIRDNNTVFSAVGACTVWAFGLETKWSFTTDRWIRSKRAILRGSVYRAVPWTPIGSD
jgi:hypothetical protein